MRRSPNQISPRPGMEAGDQPRSVVFAAARGPSSVNTAVTISRLRPSTAVTLPNCLRTWRSLIFTVGAVLHDDADRAYGRYGFLQVDSISVRNFCLSVSDRFLRDVFVVERSRPPSKYDRTPP